MRKLVVSEFVSLDGIVEAPGVRTATATAAGPSYFSPELGEYKTAVLLADDALLLGRVQYEGFAEAWPERSGDPMSDHMNAMAKYVVSASLQDPAWNNTHLLGGDMVTAVTALKEAAGRTSSSPAQRRSCARCSRPTWSTNSAWRSTR